jgi:hypothetical protein
MNATIMKRLRALEAAAGANVPYDRVERHVVNEPTIQARDARIAEIEAMSSSDTLNVFRIIITAPDRAFQRPTSS